MMRLNTSLTRTSAALSAGRSRPSGSFTGRRPRRPEAGPGIAAVSIAAVRLVGTMPPPIKPCEMLACRRGAARTLQRHDAEIDECVSRRSMGFLWNKLSRCAEAKTGVAQSASGLPRDYSSTTATQKVTSEGSCVRRVTPFSAGTRRRLTRSCGSRSTSSVHRSPSSFPRGLASPSATAKRNPCGARLRTRQVRALWPA